MKRLQNKRCLVTGAARGIGEAIAEGFIREGAQVILSDINLKQVEQTAKRLGGTPYHLDVADEAHWNAFAKDYPVLRARRAEHSLQQPSSCRYPYTHVGADVRRRT